MVKIVQLTPAQIAEHWPNMTEGFVSALPPTVTGRESLRQTVMMDLAIKELAQVWAATDNGRIVSYVYTIFQVDPVLTSRNLLVYAVFTIERTKIDVWKEGMQALVRFAKASGCLSVMAYTREQSVINMVNSVGGNTETRLVYKEVL